MTVPSWSVEHHTGPATAFHDRPLPEQPVRSLWWFEVERPAVVLGSAQPDGVVDRAAAEAAGAEVVRRRSGGGAVWLAPGTATWVDVVLPAGDELWTADVSRSGLWLGEAWSRALTDLGVEGTVVHRGGMVEGPWSRLVCFAGLGPGEVTIDGRKVVGVSQRRTRHAARFQCALLHRWDPRPLLGVLSLAPAERARAAVDLRHVATGTDPVAGEQVLEALLANLPPS